ncbi:MAG: NADH-ubiquinone oxidoreductase-F iron-sulfur binding region domain-containing protein [Pseudomonadota bacterium]|nr:NADH-ubiquinone oxidoreductase-F iron-sulfur binding region domain-containing protein [Pseudomonadota bacterium]
MTTVYVPLDSVAVAMDANAVAEQLTKAGAAVIRNGSRGLAWLEPLIEVENGGERIAYGPVSPTTVADLITNGFLHHQLIEHPLCRGPIGSHDFLQSQTRLVFDRIGHDSPLGVPDLADVLRALAIPPDDLIEMIEISGLRGRGGAGFPAHIKWRTVRETDAPRKYLVCNADEGDSGTFADRLLLEGDPFRLIEGMVIAGYATGANHGVVYLRSEYPIAETIFEQALEVAREHNLIGHNVLGSDFDFDLELFLGAGAYICGEETSLLESLEGRRGQIRVKPPVPAVSGLLSMPTLVHNVISFASVPAIVRLGGDVYRDLGVSPSSGTMSFQLAGNIKRGGLIEVPFGITLREMVEGYGHGTLSGRPFKTLQIGGPLGAYLSQRELDIELTYEAMADIGAGIGHGGLVIFDDTVDLAEQARYAFEFCELESCGKCTPCRIGSVRGKETMEQIISGRASDQEFNMIDDLCEVMDRTSLCQMGGMTPIPVRSAMERFPGDFRQGTRA